MLTVASLVWVVVFIPAWFESSQNRSDYRQAKQEVASRVKQVRRVQRQKPQTTQAQIAGKLFRLSLTRKVISLSLFSALAIGIWSCLDFAANWPILATSVFCTVLAALANRRTAVVKHKLLAESLQLSKAAKTAKPALFNYVEELAKAQAEIDARIWTPVELPKPMHLLNKVGELEAVELAEVTSISSPAVEQVDQQVQLDMPLDEILRRRRAV